MFHEIQFDNENAVEFPDYLFGSRKRKKAAAAAAQAATDKILASGQQLSNAQIQTMLLAADGKISNKDKKIIKQAQRQDAKTDRVAVRQEAKTERTGLEQSGSTDRTALEQTGQTASTLAAQQPSVPDKGIMPMETPSNTGGLLSGGGGGDLGGSYPEMQSWTEAEQDMSQQAANNQQAATQQATGTKQKNIGIIIGVVVVVVVLIFAFMKMKKK